ncbi:sensor histidine kinase [Herbidospora mongoliensis]|uniref:sensor histidine kinase n=1 Tax=Herbidospora mongoliensis TaxID=688067 RepID=UPI000B238CD9|nr:histidine kinase [Herbidospora mongoliensis]
MSLRRDTLLAAVLTLLAFVPTVSGIGAEIGDLPKHPSDALAVTLTLALTLPLALRTRRPAACLAIVGMAFALHQTLSYPPTFGTVGIYLALYAAGAHQVRLRRTTQIAAATGYIILAIVLYVLGSPRQIPDFLAFSLVLMASWAAGALVRRWRADEAERRRLSAQVAVAAERARIARELHDVVTHHVTAMVVQADAAQYLMDSAPDRAGDSLTAISGTGRRALTELRSLLGVLEATGDPAAADRTPALGKVSDLVEQARLSGQPVEWTELGAPLAQSVDVELAVYRVVQEALTNALKHATGHPTAVLVRHGDTHIEIEVTTEGSSTTPATAPGGRGLAGLRERVRMLNGELIAGPRPEGGFSVRALIPSRSDT